MNLSRCSRTALCGAWEGGRGPLWLTTDVRYDSLYWIDSFGSDPFKWIELPQSPHTMNRLTCLASEDVDTLIYPDPVSRFYSQLKLALSSNFASWVRWQYSKERFVHQLYITCVWQRMNVVDRHFLVFLDTAWWMQWILQIFAEKIPLIKRDLHIVLNCLLFWSDAMKMTFDSNFT